MPLNWSELDYVAMEISEIDDPEKRNEVLKLTIESMQEREEADRKEFLRLYINRMMIINANRDYKQNEKGNTPLMELLTSFCTSEPKDLKPVIDGLMKKGVDLGVRNSQGCNALEMMIKKYERDYNSEQSARLSLLRKGFLADRGIVEDNEVSDYLNEEIRDMMIQEVGESLGYCMSFVEKNPKYWNYDFKDSDGNTPLILLVKSLRVLRADEEGNYCKHLIGELKDRIKSYIRDKDFDINAVNDKGNNALMELAESEGATIRIIDEIGDFLREFGLKTETKNREGKTLVDIIDDINHGRSPSFDPSVAESSAAPLKGLENKNRF